MENKPWKDAEEIDYTQDAWDILGQYRNKHHRVVISFIRHYYTAKLWKAACLAGWTLSIGLMIVIGVAMP